MVNWEKVIDYLIIFPQMEIDLYRDFINMFAKEKKRCMRFDFVDI